MTKPTIHSHTITHNLIVFNGVRECFAFAKPHKPTLQPKLGGSVCLSNSITKTTDKPTDEEEHRSDNRVDGSARSSDGVHLSNVNSRIPIKNNEQSYEYTPKRTRALLLSFSKMSPRHF